MGMALNHFFKQGSGESLPCRIDGLYGGRKLTVVTRKNYFSRFQNRNPGCSFQALRCLIDKYQVKDHPFEVVRSCAHQGTCKYLGLLVNIRSNVVLQMLREFSDAAHFLIQELALRSLLGSEIPFVLLGQL